MQIANPGSFNEPVCVHVLEHVSLVIDCISDSELFETDAVIFVGDAGLVGGDDDIDVAVLGRVERRLRVAILKLCLVHRLPTRLRLDYFTQEMAPIFAMIHVNCNRITKIICNVTLSNIINRLK